MKYGIENHPSIFSEYVKFLVTNTPSRGEGVDVEERLDVIVEII